MAVEGAAVLGGAAASTRGASRLLPPPLLGRALPGGEGRRPARRVLR